MENLVICVFITPNQRAFSGRNPIEVIMNYEIHGLPEVLAGVIVFAFVASLFWFFAERRDISDDTRSFR